MKHTITLIRGDGTGPEVTDAAVACLEATGVTFSWDIQEIGEAALKNQGTPVPDVTLKSIAKNKVALKGPVTTPVGTGFRSANVALRQMLDLYANVRPARLLPGVESPYKNVDLVIVRENTEDLYAGIEFEKGAASTKKLIEFVEKSINKKIRPDSGISLKVNSVFASERIVDFAFKYALEHKRKRVTAVHKANIMKFSDGLFLDAARRVAARYPKMPFEDRIVDNMCMQLVQKPDQYDVLVLPNLYGDIVSDLCAGLVGGLGLAPSGNIGAKGAVFEPVHGSAPKYAGKNKVNPTATILAGVMMLHHLEEHRAADALERAVIAVLKEGKAVTYDLKPKHPVGTKEMAQAIIGKIR